MTRMFCTLQEAAEKLNTDVGGIEALLEDGTLREYREGTYRLVREADVGALTAVRRRSANESRPSRPQAGPAQPLTAPRPMPQTRRFSAGTRLPASAAAARTGRAQAAEAKRTSWTPRDRYRPEPVGRQIQMSVQELTVRQWFWNGLMQDQPLAIAILAGTALLVLAVIAVGVCLLAEGS